MKRTRPISRSAKLHGWHVDPSTALKIQEQLRNRLSLKDRLTFREIRRIAGADVAYAADGETIFGAVVVLSFPELAVVEESWAKGKIGFPYIPGLLSFREAPVLIKAFASLKKPPDLLFLDGQGIAHPRGFGLASHVGLWLGLPSIGCAKTRLVGEHRPVGRQRGSFSRLKFQGRTVGAAVRSRTDVKPIFVSPGDRISLRSAIRLALAACKGYRIPEPIRRAHQLAHRLRVERGG